MSLSNVRRLVYVCLVSTHPPFLVIKSMSDRWRGGGREARHAGRGADARLSTPFFLEHTVKQRNKPGYIRDISFGRGRREGAPPREPFTRRYISMGFPITGSRRNNGVTVGPGPTTIRRVASRQRETRRRLAHARASFKARRTARHGTHGGPRCRAEGRDVFLVVASVQTLLSRERLNTRREGRKHYARYPASVPLPLPLSPRAA